MNPDEQQPSPEILQQLMAQGQGGQPPMEEDDPANGEPRNPELAGSEDPMTGGHPESMMADPQQIQPQEIEPLDMLNEVVTNYMKYSMAVLADSTLDKPVQSKILVEQAGAIASLVQLLPSFHEMQAEFTNTQGQGDNSQELEMKAQEMEMKKQQHEADLQMKQAIHDQTTQIQNEKHQMEVQKMAHDMEMSKAQMEHQHHMKSEEHQQKLVHNEKEHESKIQQAKQAAQSKPSNKQGSNKGAK